MRTHKELYWTTPTIYTCTCASAGKCELETCPQCGGALAAMPYLNGLKTVQTMTQVLTMAYRVGAAHRPKRCTVPTCKSDGVSWPSAAWQQVAPKYGTYGYDVMVGQSPTMIAQIGWERQKSGRRFAAIHSDLAGRIQISEAQVRYSYYQRYLPLLACHERQHLDELKVLSQQRGLLLGLDGLMPEGGEPQLW